MNVIFNDIAQRDDASRAAGIEPVEHRSSQIGAGPQYVVDVLGRFASEPADAVDTPDAAPVVLGYN
ncbi:hypothetical protein [Burkholderia dolosa]|jgi:hypothetical protein|uniref:hypothetical protein n=1 Tax=Burkholderia dolosa TaxID=152500 RepID=UPI001B8F6A70|nr:hypothetical protein [Burkholderia dolosa]MBR8059472.1 hypothetical protein [Burkholderia dolosa]MBR8301861.1 hypothetical protein [Burkholderia dolosa]MBY4832394.1 hypothetical protein [Burkholderia dolosa]